MKPNGPHDPAFPVPAVVLPNGTTAEYGTDGLSVREWYAGMAMQGLLAAGKFDGTSHGLASRAFGIADAMIKQAKE